MRLHRAHHDPARADAPAPGAIHVMPHERAREASAVIASLRLDGLDPSQIATAIHAWGRGRQSLDTLVRTGLAISQVRPAGDPDHAA